MVEFKFEQENVERLAPVNDNALGDIRFRKLLGAKDWNALPAAVRARFSKRVKGGESTIYKGYVVKTEMNRAGRVFANLLRIVGAPLPLDSHNADAPAIVTVTEDADYQGQFWSRLGHADHGDGWFEFSLELEHPWFRKLMDQRVMFRDGQKL